MEHGKTHRQTPPTGGTSAISSPAWSAEFSVTTARRADAGDLLARFGLSSPEQRTRPSASTLRAARRLCWVIHSGSCLCAARAVRPPEFQGLCRGMSLAEREHACAVGSRPRRARTTVLDLPLTATEPTTSKPRHPKRPPTPGRRRPVLPREHGAYALLLFPLASALLLGAPGGAAAALAVATVLGFLVHPAIVDLASAHRGRSRRPRAVLALAGLGATTALVALVLAPSLARVAFGAFVVGTTCLAGLAAMGHQRSAAFEALAAVVLPSSALPVAIAAEVLPARALACWSIWAVGFLAGCISVRSTIAKRRPPHAWVLPTLLASAVLGCALSLSNGQVPQSAWLSMAPLVGASILFVACPPHPRYLRATGWAMASASTVTLAIIVGTLR